MEKQRRIRMVEGWKPSENVLVQLEPCQSRELCARCDTDVCGLRGGE